MYLCVCVCFLCACTVFDTHSGWGLPLKQLSLQNWVEGNAIRHISSAIHHWLLWLPQGEERREWPIDTARNTHTHTHTHKWASVSDSFVTKNENTDVLMRGKTSKQVCLYSLTASNNPTLGKLSSISLASVKSRPANMTPTEEVDVIYFAQGHLEMFGLMEKWHLNHTVREQSSVLTDLMDIQIWESHSYFSSK